MGTRGLIVVCVVWAVVVGAGFALLYIYKARPGSSGTPAAQWPADTRLALDRTRPNLVMLAHPQCPCTRASVAELARLIARVGDRVRAHVLFVKPDGVDASWQDTDLWRSAAAIPGVTVGVDELGEEARRFGIETSGHVLLYDATGALQFRGGITSSRGHEGDSFGQRRIVALLTTQTPDRADAPVFGCNLFDSNVRRSTESP
ncbi:MAG TPA: hypothetical protein VIV11_38660 [Kofleriaceae bacterium]